MIYVIRIPYMGITNDGFVNVYYKSACPRIMHTGLHIVIWVHFTSARISIKCMGKLFYIIRIFHMDTPTVGMNTYNMHRNARVAQKGGKGKRGCDWQNS